MQGPVSPDSLSPSSWVRMSSICSRWDGMLVSVTGALSSNSRGKKNRNCQRDVQRQSSTERKRLCSASLKV